MKRFARVVAVATLALPLGGCLTWQEFGQDLVAFEQRAAVFIAKVKAGAVIARDEAEAILTETCGGVPTFQIAVANLTATIQNPGPKFKTAIVAANRGFATAAAACTEYSASMNGGTPPSLGRTVTLAVSIWNAYQAGKAAYRAAQNAPQA